MIFEWDPAKAASNIQKHGIEFDDAAFVFQDPFLLESSQYVEGEERWEILGMVDDHLLTVIVQYKSSNDGEQIVRLISARRATRHERKYYHEAHRA